MNDSQTKKKRGFASWADPHTFLPATVVLVAAVIWGFVSPESFGAATSAAMDFVAEKFGWWYALVISVFLFFCLWIMFGKVGKIRFGGKDAKPEFSNFTWFTITLTSTIAVGILFYCVSEPMGNFLSPPAFTELLPGSAGALEHALPLTYMHWAIQPYALYGAIGVCIGVMYWNTGRKFKISSALYPILGDKCDGRAGSWVNSLCLFTMVAGIGTSFGLGVLQLSTSIEYAFNIDLPTIPLWAAIVFGYAFLYIMSSASGLKKAVSVISDANVYIYIIMLVAILFLGGTTFILNNTVTSVGKYIMLMIEQVFYLEPAYDSGWVNANTMFYWGWWFVYAPVTGLFMIKLAKGRTLREFVIVNMVLPGLFAIVWFGFFGSAAMNVEFNGVGGIAAAIEQYGIPVGLFALLKTQKFSVILIILAFLAMLFSFITLTQSMTITLADMTSAKVLKAGNDDTVTSPLSLKVFWGILMALIAFILLLSGGLNALQMASVVCGLPITFLLLAMLWAFIKATKDPKKYNLYGDAAEAATEEAEEEAAEMAAQEQ